MIILIDLVFSELKPIFCVVLEIYMNIVLRNIFRNKIKNKLCPYYHLYLELEIFYSLLIHCKRLIVTNILCNETLYSVFLVCVNIMLDFAIESSVISMDFAFISEQNRKTILSFINTFSIRAIFSLASIFP